MRHLSSNGAASITAALFATLVAHASAAPSDYFAIHIIDDATGRGVPLVELQTTYKQRYYTDSAGYIAFNEPGLMNGEELWFDVRSYGYESPSGPFGSKGLSLKPLPGKSAEVRLKRINIAERLYRLTGYGIYRDSVLLAKKTPLKEPLLNARVAGQDTVQTAIYKNRFYWMWGDTDRMSFVLGCFAMTGATTPLPGKLKPEEGIDFTYFVEAPGKFARAMADVPVEGTHPIWVDGLTVVKDDRGEERMLARYVAVDSAMKAVETGLCLFNDQRQILERFKKFEGDGTATLAPSGKPYRARYGDKTYVCFPGGVRVLADFANASDPSKYESFTCLTRDGKVERNADGTVTWRWQQNMPRVTPEQINELVKRGELKREELPVAFTDVDTGKPVKLAGGSIAWNPYLKQWTYVFGESMGATNVGECWFATAASPDGPWRAARKIATHAMPRANYDLYNVIQHDEFAGDGGRLVYFEGTFVNTFSGTQIPTPYYNYNNLMYRIDLADKRLKLPDPPAGLTDVNPE